MICPKCGSDHVDRVEVDVGVGVQCGPWTCYECDWVEWKYDDDPDIDAQLEAQDEETEDAR